ncbi:hypothetical protein [Christiangramia forsetii]|uniref:Secreted protein n=2 Tax=Christiangramia forsetii TaxID=411153 RepID=A0M4P2_CHRFK|nr:hypothetical protein [Christiangramia forsetii]GGG22974.1 hypothetical protein GCM10011532_02600 [Christiangramia forsetii]CAL67587.1 secreted protein [Christiangramia forsetii KT0803]
MMKPNFKLVPVFLFIFLIGSIHPCNAATVEVGKKKVRVSTSESDAEIFVNGKKIGSGSAEVLVPKDDCVTVTAEKVGFLFESIEFCNQKGMASPPKTHYVEMRRDDAFDASVQTDIANVDIEFKVSDMSKDKAWKLINQIVLNYIDVIEMTDKETGYLRTAWSLQTFKQNTIRTRMIVKESNSNPLVFKIKLVSEESGNSMTSVKSDHLYKEWDRVLRSYDDAIGEFQARVK